MIRHAFLALALASALTAPAHAVTLVYSNDINGEIEPCGCRNSPMGGLVRKSNLLQRIEGPVLQLDAGDFLFNTAPPLPEALAAQAEVQAAYLIKAHDLLKHDAVVPGEKDFALGLKVFDRLRKKAKFPFLAANLVRAKGGAPLLEASRVFTRTEKDGQKVRIAVIGLVGETLHWPRELKATSAIAAAKKQVAALRKKVDYVIALTHQGFDEDARLAESVPGIDVIVGGHTQSFLQTPPKVGGTTIYQSSFRNQYVGVVPLTKPAVNENHKLTGLDAGYETPEDVAGPMGKLVVEFKSAVAEINSKEELKLSRVNTGANGGIKYQTFPRCAECHLLQFDFWRKTRHANALDPLLAGNQIRNKDCLGCHSVGLGDQEGFSNVNAVAERVLFTQPSPRPSDEAPGEPVATTDPVALEDLAAYMKDVHKAKSLKDEVRLVRADADATDIRKTLAQLKRSWAPVQCENCHQPGRDHPFSGTYAKTVENTTCLKCHTADRAPEWYTKSGQPDWEKIAPKRVSITCPAGSFTEED